MKLEITLLFALFLTWTSGAPSASVQEFVNGNNLFTAATYRESVKVNNDNILVSPLSTELLFALAQSGAKGKTAEEIRTSLRLPDTDEETRFVVKSILPTLKGDGHFFLQTADKIYLQQNFPIKEEFIQVARETYEADIENINFAQNVEAANIINEWAEKETDNKIQNLVDPSMFDDSTIAVLINALHFNGKWDIPFISSETAKKQFYKTNEDIVEVDMMYNSRMEYYYFENKELDAQFLKLPFLGEDISMIVVLPNEKEGIAALETQIEKLFVQSTQWITTSLNITLPKFKIESTIDLKETLINLGVTTAFTPHAADFSGITDEELYLSSAMQKAYINVDEDGVEAAAISFGTADVTSIPPPAVVHFNADHPFVFYIQINDLVLFAGRVITPLM